MPFEPFPLRNKFKEVQGREKAHPFVVPCLGSKHASLRTAVGLERTSAPKLLYSLSEDGAICTATTDYLHWPQIFGQERTTG